MAETAWWSECEVAGHSTSSVRNQRDEHSYFVHLLPPPHSPTPLFLTQSGTPVHGKAPPTFRASLSSSVKLWKLHCRHTQNCAYWMILELVKLRLKINHDIYLNKEE